MSVEIRAVGPDEYETAVDVMTAAFLDRLDTARVAETARTTWEPGRTLVAFEDGRACGTFRTWSTEITTPGGALLPATAVTAVTVLPTHRRRGILTAMMARGHAEMRERGEAAGILYASEYPIYRRFGYGPAARYVTWTIRSRETAWIGAAHGGVELAPLDQATADAMRDVYETCRPRQAGEVRRRDVDWPMSIGLRPAVFGEPWKGFVALRRDAAGVVDGYARYQAKSEWPDNLPQGSLDVADLHAVSPEAYASLWRFLAEVDLVTVVKAEGRKASEPLPWLAANQRAVRQGSMIDGLWVRLLDLPRALSTRAWERAGSLVLEVVEPSEQGEAGVPGVRQRLALDVEPGGARCTPTNRPADLVLPAAAIGAAWLGGTRLRDIVLTTGCDEDRAGALAEADALFRSADEPWCSTGF